MRKIIYIAISMLFLLSCVHRSNESVTEKIIKQEIKKTEKVKIKRDSMGNIKDSVEKIKNIDIPEIKKHK